MRNLTNLIDHAPLFPPAALPPDDALAAHGQALNDTRVQCLHALVWPRHMLSIVNDSAARPVTGGPIAIALLDERLQDIAPVARDGIGVIQFEAAIDPTDIAAELQHATRVARDATVFAEIPPAALADEAELDRILDRLADAGLAAKIRCGGATAIHVPSARSVALFVRGCVSRDLVFKATAGLHEAWAQLTGDHPRHGLANLVVATAAARDGAAPGRLEALLTSTRRAPLAPETVASARKSLASIGSCSFKEPLDALEPWLEADQ